MAPAGGRRYPPAVTRVLAIALVFLGALGLSLASAPDACADDCCEEAEPVAADGCDSPCPGEGDDGACPAGCDLCVCCPATVSPPLATPPAGPGIADAVAAAAFPEPPDRLAAGQSRRLFRPPIASHS